MWTPAVKSIDEEVDGEAAFFAVNREIAMRANSWNTNYSPLRPEPEDFKLFLQDDPKFVGVQQTLGRPARTA
jgi:hypothetical protein